MVFGKESAVGKTVSFVYRYFYRARTNVVDHFATLKLYFEGKSEKEIEAISKKAQVVGFTRILRRCIRLGKEQSLIDCVKEKLLSLLDEVDSLTF